jgi:hypothetical protein
MIRTRLAQAAAVATLALGTVILLPSTAGALPSTQAAALSVQAPATVTPDNGTWG